MDLAEERIAGTRYGEIAGNLGRAAPLVRQVFSQVRQRRPASRASPVPKLMLDSAPACSCPPRALGPSSVAIIGKQHGEGGSLFYRPGEPAMTHPADPVLLFDEDGRMFILHEPALADELIESVDEFFEGYDGHGRPVRAHGEPGHVVLALAAMEPRADELRSRVERYYLVFAARHPTRIPPQESDLTAFIRAVAEDWIEE